MLCYPYFKESAFTAVKIDCEQSLFFYKFSLRGRVHARASVKRRSREMRKTRAAAREEKRETLFCRAPHLRVSGVLLDGPRKKRERLLVRSLQVKGTLQHSKLDTWKGYLLSMKGICWRGRFSVRNSIWKGKGLETVGLRGGASP